MQTIDPNGPKLSFHSIDIRVQLPKGGSQEREPFIIGVNVYTQTFYFATGKAPNFLSIDDCHFLAKVVKDVCDMHEKFEIK